MFENFKFKRKISSLLMLSLTSISSVTSATPDFQEDVDPSFQRAFIEAQLEALPNLEVRAYRDTLQDFTPYHTFKRLKNELASGVNIKVNSTSTESHQETLNQALSQIYTFAEKWLWVNIFKNADKTDIADTLTVIQGKFFEDWYCEDAEDMES